MFDDEDDASRFRAKSRGAGRRMTISSQVSHADLDLETSAGPLRLYVTSSILVEVDVDACLPDEFVGEPAPRPEPRLPKRTRR
jgi:hypothetical protein